MHRHVPIYECTEQIAIERGQTPNWWLRRQYEYRTRGSWGQETVRDIRFFVIDLGVVLLDAIDESRGQNGSLRRMCISREKVSWRLSDPPILKVSSHVTYSPFAEKKEHEERKRD